MATQSRSLARIAAVLLGASVVLAGCAATLPGSSTTPAKPGATATPTPFIDTAAGIRIAKAAVKALNTDPLIAHLEQVSTGTIEYKGQTSQVFATMSADFAGADMAVDIDITGIDQKLDGRVRVVGKDAWVYQGGAWIKGKRSKIKADLADAIDAVRIVKDPNELRYFGTERVGKKDLEHFRVNRALTYDGAFGIVGRYDTFDIWVTSEGTPVRYEATISAEDAKVGKVTGKMVVDITKFGGPIKIKPPKGQ
jgi:hypothetical protein